MTKVLIVDDEPQLVRTLRINLQARGYDVVTAADGTQALQAAASAHPDLVILDLGLPDLDGVDVIRKLRTWTPIPIVVLSGRTESTDKVEALDTGANDYVTKPFSIDELLARMRAATRRLDLSETPPPTRIGRYEIDVGTRTVRLIGADGEAPHLTRTEWQLIEILLRDPGRLVGQRELLEQVWGPTYLNETHYLRQYLAQLRRKLEDNPAQPRHLLTEPGMGYRFQP